MAGDVLVRGVYLVSEGEARTVDLRGGVLVRIAPRRPLGAHELPCIRCGRRGGGSRCYGGREDCVLEALPPHAEVVVLEAARSGASPLWLWVEHTWRPLTLEPWDHVVARLWPVERPEVVALQKLTSAVEKLARSGEGTESQIQNVACAVRALEEQRKREIQIMAEQNAAKDEQDEQQEKPSRWAEVKTTAQCEGEAALMLTLGKQAAKRVAHKLLALAARSKRIPRAWIALAKAAVETQTGLGAFALAMGLIVPFVPRATATDFRRKMVSSMRVWGGHAVTDGIADSVLDELLGDLDALERDFKIETREIAAGDSSRARSSTPAGVGAPVHA